MLSEAHHGHKGGCACMRALEGPNSQTESRWWAPGTGVGVLGGHVSWGQSFRSARWEDFWRHVYNSMQVLNATVPYT